MHISRRGIGARPAGLMIFADAGVACASAAPRDVPAKVLPVPTADVSAGLQALIARPLKPDWNKLWSTGAAWRAAANRQAAIVLPTIPPMLARLQVTSTAAVIDGVRVHLLTPATIPPAHRDKLLIHVHGGCYELFPGAAGTPEGIMMAGFGHDRVVSVDYRMPPEAYFATALDDAIAIYRDAPKTHDARDIAFFGTSAGGALTLVLRARQLGLKMPGAIAPGTPMSDVTKTGDSFSTNEKVDNVLVSRDGFCDAATVVYAHGHDLADPLLSPVNDDMHGFPPAILTTGTRDLLLSNTVRVHRKLKRAGVKAELEVYEGMSHAQYEMDDQLPETREAFTDIATFFGQHLGH